MFNPNTIKSIVMFSFCPNLIIIILKMLSLQDLPLNIIIIIMQKVSSQNFLDFFNLFLLWSATQKQSIIRILLDNYPLEELYCWGHEVHRPRETMFLRFMRIAKNLKNKDAMFYLAFTSVIFRRYEDYKDFGAAYKELDYMSTKNHPNSMLLKSMMDIYYFPDKRHGAISTIFNLATSSTRIKIPKMIRTFRIITRAIYPDTFFDQILAPPICNKYSTDEEKHYHPDGMPVYSHEIDNFTCNNCKVAVIFACLE